MEISWKSIASIDKAMLFRSQLDNFLILQYEKDNQSLAVTINEETKICGRSMYLTGVPNVIVLLLKDLDEYIKAPHMETQAMLEEVMHEEDVRAALNMIELSLDRLYKNINMRMCELSRIDISITSALLRSGINTLYDERGAPLLVHVNGEMATLFRCTAILAQIRHDEGKCCSEIPIWIGSNFSTKASAEATSKRVVNICTPKLCSSYESPTFNLGTD